MAASRFTMQPILYSCFVRLIIFSAGQGTSGADGGEGGAIEIHLHEDNTHLLMAAVWNIDGGHGGAPGHHGNAGQGGPGGSGGKGHKW